MLTRTPAEDTARTGPWPDGLTRVPYWVFQRQDVYAAEQERLFRGPFWSYLCLEAEVRDPGDYRATFVGETPVVVARDVDGELYAFENRCAHRGALLALEDQGKTKDFTCVYHGWSYSLQGDLTGVAFKDGIKGKGGMPKSFCMQEHGPRKLRVAVVHGLIFGSFDEDVPDIEDYLGDEVIARIGRVLGNRRPVILGKFTQGLPSNWKLYMENVKDPYHASILHLFFTTFELNKMSMKGEIIITGNGAHHVSYSAIDRAAEQDAAYAQQDLRSKSDYALADPTLLDGFSEVGDDVTLQILSVFPGLVVQQIQNCVAVRQIIPRGVEKTDLDWVYLGFEDDTPEQRRIRLRQSNLVGPAGFISMEDGCVGGFIQRGTVGAPDECEVIEMGGHTADSSESRVTEASIRGFWKVYRQAMAL